jgi:hypothetical protein
MQTWPALAPRLQQASGWPATTVPSLTTSPQTTRRHVAPHASPSSPLVGADAELVSALLKPAGRKVVRVKRCVKVEQGKAPNPAAAGGHQGPDLHVRASECVCVPAFLAHAWCA